MTPQREPGCPSCGEVVAPGARFCRSCGAALGDETRAGSDVPPADAGEGDAAPLAVMPQSGHRCEICGGSLEGKARTCSSCMDLLGQGVPEPTVAIPVDPAPDPSTPPRAERRPGRFTALVAVIVLLFAAAGAAAAYFLVIAPDKDDKEAGASARGAGGAPEEPEETGDPTPVGESQAASAADIEEAQSVLRDHYVAIDEGSYERARKHFHPDYRSSRAGVKFVKLRKAGRPAIDLESLAVTPVEGGSDESLVLELDFVAADTAGADQKCRHFTGPVQMEVSDGEWTYRPGGPGKAQPGLETVRISPSDARCSRVSVRRKKRPRGSRR